MSRQPGAGNHGRLVAFAAVILAILTMAGVGAWRWRLAPPPSRTSAAMPAPCRSLVFEGDEYVVCELPHADYAVAVGHNDGQTNPVATLGDFIGSRPSTTLPPVLAMNGGMYRLDLSPLGLLIEEGQEISPVALGSGTGNFYLKPNGIFLVAPDGTPRIMESSAWAATRPPTRFATQSGPMLVSGGRIHSAFDTNGSSRYRRNGVGLGDGRLYLAVSRGVVSFGAFARLFRDELRCSDALYLDGAVSALAGSDGTIVGGTFPAGPVIVVNSSN